MFQGPFVVAAGARAAEEVVLRLVADDRERVRADHGLLAAPLRLVVPSTGLRDHLLGRLVAHLGSLAGVRVETLFAVALELADRSGGPRCRSERGVELLARRLIGAEPSLAGLEDGAWRPVRDLLDAGLTSEHLDSALELVDVARSDGVLGPGEHARASALLRAAGGVERAARAVGFARRGTVLAQAAEALAAEPALLGARGVIVAGFADLTGLGLDLLEVLVRGGARVVLDLPPDPGATAPIPDPGRRFADRLSLRLVGRRAADLGWEVPRVDPVAVDWLLGADRWAEARLVAAAVRSDLDHGLPPESIGLVAPDLTRYGAPLRVACHRLAIPFDAPSAPPTDASNRRFGALVRLVEGRLRSPLGAWFTAAGAELSWSERRRCLESGATTVGEAAELVPEIAATARVLAAAPAVAPVSSWRMWWMELLGSVDLSDGDRDPWPRWPAALELDQPEVSWLVATWWEDERGRRRPTHGGVSLLDPTEARGRTWAQLYLLGVERGEFPRRHGEDPLLPDPLRRAMSAVLPDLAVASDRLWEERYRFAHLLSSATRVTLSARESDESGRLVVGSPYRSCLGQAVERPTASLSRLAGGHEAGRAMALTGGISGVAAAIALACRAEGRPDAEELGRVRAAILAELDASPADGSYRRLGPYLGLVGGALRRPPTVTDLEALVRCPWQAFLTRILALEGARPSAPERADIDAATVGTIVHRVVEALAVAGGGTLEWPEQGELARRVRLVATELAHPPVLAGALAARALAHLDVAGPILGGLPVAGAELETEARVRSADGSTIPVRFRADLAERRSDGIALLDLKTSRPPFGARDPRGALRREIEQGLRLQAAAYAASGRATSGGYLFLGPAHAEETRPRRVEVGVDEARLFARVAGRLVDAWRRGGFPPRLVADDLESDGPACRWCGVAEACLRFDSGSHRRVARVLGAAAVDDPLGQLARELLLGGAAR